MRVRIKWQSISWGKRVPGTPHAIFTAISPERLTLKEMIFQLDRGDYITSTALKEHALYLRDESRSFTAFSDKLKKINRSFRIQAQMLSAIFTCGICQAAFSENPFFQLSILALGDISINSSAEAYCDNWRQHFLYALRSGRG
jgi:hypothetical protein